MAACGRSDFQLFTLAPIIGGYGLLGERAKWVSVSRQRFSKLVLGSRGGSVEVSVQPGERVVVMWATPSGIGAGYGHVESVCNAPAPAAGASTVLAMVASVGPAGGSCALHGPPGPGYA